MRLPFASPLLLIAAAALSMPAAQAQSTDVRAAPTYESIGLYWSNPGADPAAGCDVRFRRAGDADFRPGLALWFDAASNECRGSLVQLAAGTTYEVQLGLPGQMPLRTISAQTWSNRKPVVAVVNVAGGSGTLDIRQGGSPSGYVVYEGSGAVLDAANASASNITINASFVIVRGFTLRGAQQDAISISPAVTDVIIEDNDISGWGRQRSGTFGVDMDSAIRAVCNGNTLERVTIQRNRIHDPRFGANSWSDGHPAGPQAVTFSRCGGNHVIRHNEISSSADHYYNDIIGGEDNFSTAGFPNYDSDIYGNRLSNCWDDAIESEGGNRNVRVWGNYIDNTTTGIATALTSVGPFYAFRNVYNRNRELAAVPLDADARQELFKAGSDPAFADGRRYFFHNTTLQAMQAGATRTLGVAFGISGSGPTQPFNNTVSRNNIYHTWDDTEIVYRQPGTGNEFTNDMFNGVANVPMTGGIHAAPTYAPGNGWQSESGGAYALAAGTPGFDGGVRIPNFNDAFAGAAPDVGAAEAGFAPFRYGFAASPGSAVSARVDATLTIASSANPAQSSQVVTFTATVAGNFGTPTGTVAFNDGGSTLAGCGAVALSGGTATCAVGSLAAGSHGITAAYSGDANYNAGFSGVLTEVIDAPPASANAHLVNISTRGRVLTGDDVMIAGFIIDGGAKTVVVTAAGPSLAASGIADPLANPTLTLVRSSDHSIVASNDDWGNASNANQIVASGLAPSDARESAILMTLAPGAYTAIVSGVGGGTGVGLVAVYEVDHPEAAFANLSTRGRVLTGNDVMIGGFIVQGSGPKTMVITGTGPSLAASGIAQPLADPTLTLVRSSDQSIIATNDNWGDAANAADVRASGLAPSDPRESAIMITLQPGAYTAILSGVGGSTGVGVAAVYSR